MSSAGNEPQPQPQSRPAESRPQQPYPPQRYPQQPYPHQEGAYGQSGQPVPGRTLGIIGFVLSLLGPLTVAGLVVSIVGMVQSRRAHAKNGFALAGIIIGAVGAVLLILAVVFMVIGVGYLAQVCGELGPGTHFQDGVTYTCG